MTLIRLLSAITASIVIAVLAVTIIVLAVGLWPLTTLVDMALYGLIDDNAVTLGMIRTLERATELLDRVGDFFEPTDPWG